MTLLCGRAWLSAFIGGEMGDARLLCAIKWCKIKNKMRLSSFFKSKKGIFVMLKLIGE